MMPGVASVNSLHSGTAETQSEPGNSAATSRSVNSGHRGAKTVYSGWLRQSLLKAVNSWRLHGRSMSRVPRDCEFPHSRITMRPPGMCHIRVRERALWWVAADGGARR